MSKRKEKIIAKCDKCGERMRVGELGDGTFSITCDKCGISENVSRADKRLRTLCEYVPGQGEDEKDTYLGKFIIAFSIIVIFIGIIGLMVSFGSLVVAVLSFLEKRTVPRKHSASAAAKRMP